MSKRIDRIHNFRYPVSQPTVFDEQELTVLELVSKVAYKINETVDGVNEWFDYLDNFVEHFEFELQEEVKGTLTKWQNEGRLDDIINSALNTRLDSFEDETNRKLADITTYPSKYGATGNGIKDDTIPFQNALDNVVGGTVDLEGRHYAITGVKINKKLHLKNGKITLLDNALQSAIEIVSTVDGVKISDLEIYINKDTVIAENASGIFVNGASNTTIENVYVDGSKNNNYGPYYHSCIYGHEVDTITITNCTIRNSHKEGIMTRDSDDVYIYNCKAYDSGFSGIGTSGGNRAIIDNCISFRTGASCITMNSKDSIVSNCIVSENIGGYSSGINVGHGTEEQSPDNCVVSNNRVIRTGTSVYTYGITVAYVKNAIISGNNVSNAETRGIIVIGKRGYDGSIKVSNNTLSNCSIEVYSIDKITADITGNSVVNFTGTAIHVRLNGRASVNNNIITNVNAGIMMTGYYGSGATDEFLDVGYINGNSFNEIATNSITICLTKEVVISNNTFNNVNKNSNPSGYAIHSYAFINEFSGPRPNMSVSDNILIGNNGGLAFINIEANGFDEVVRDLIVKNNVLTELSPSHNLIRIVEPTKVKREVYGNKIGKDNKIVLITLPTGQTSVVIENTNFFPSEFLPTLVPANAYFYESKPFIYTYSNVGVTIKYIDIGVNTTVYLSYP